MAEYVESLRYEADITDVRRKLAQLKDATDDTQRGHDASVGRMSRSWDGFHRVTSAAIDVVKRVGLVAGAALGAAGVFGVKAAADFQQTRIAFEGILGSGERAQAFLTQLRDFAAKTPFEFPELAGAARQLLGVGFAASDVIPIMTKIGNVTAALGVGAEGVNGVVRALGQMQGKGKASAEELQQISEAIPGFSAIKAIAESMGITTAEAFKKMEKGAIPADQAIQAILAGMERFPGASGAMDRQSTTLAGVISTLKDTFRNALIDGIEPFLPSIASGLQRAMPRIQGAVQGTVRFVGNLVTQLGNLVRMFRSGDADGQGFAEILDNIFGNTGRLVPVLRGLWEVGERVVGVFRVVAGFVRDNLAPVLTALAVIVAAALVPALASAAASLAALLSPAVLVVGAIAAVSAGLVYAYQHFEGFRNVVDAVGRFLTGTAVPAVRAFAAAVIDRISAAVETVVEIWPQISEAIGHVMNVIAGIVRTAIDVISALWRAWGDDLVNIVRARWEFIRGTIDNALQVIRGAIQFVLAIINGDWGRAWDGIKQVLAGVWDQIVNVVRTAVALVGSVIGGIVSTFAEVFRPLGNLLHTWIVQPVEGIVGLFAGLGARFKAAAGNMFGWIVDLFKSAINSVLNIWNNLKFPSFKIGGWDPPGPLPALPSFTTPEINFPNIRLLAEGGIVKASRGGTLALLGEGGRDEAVIPLPAWLKSGPAASAAGSVGPAVGSVRFDIVVHGNAGDAHSRAELVALIRAQVSEANDQLVRALRAGRKAS